MPFDFSVDGRLSHPLKLALPTFLLALALGGALVACTGEGGAVEAASKPAAATSATPTEEELVPVEVATLERGPIESVLRFSTNLEAESAVEVYSQAARLVRTLAVEEGDAVAKGELLLRLQDEEQKSNLARVTSQLEKARREHERQKNLFAQNLISEQAMNDSTYQVEQLDLALADAKRELGYTEVRAPISGVVTRRLVSLGDHVTLNQHLFDLVDFDTIVARIYVPEKEMPRLRLGESGRIFSSSLGGGVRHGEVVRIAPIVDPKSGTVKITVSVPRQQGLLPGMYVEVELVTETHDDALLVPKRAVVYDAGRAFVFRLRDDMTVERLPLEPLVEDPISIEPAAGGALQEGDRIVLAGQAGLKEGTRVRLAGDKQIDAPPEDLPPVAAATAESAP